MIEIINSGILYRNPHPDFRPIHASFPVILPLFQGEMICVYRRGSAFSSVDGRIAQLRSLDGGITWAEEGLVWDGSKDGTNYCYRGAAPAMLTDGTVLMTCSRFDRSDPDKPVFSPETEGYLPCQVVVFRSRDGGHSWTPPQVVPLPEGMVANGSGPVIEVGGGRLLLPIETWKAYDDPNPPKQRAMALFSGDGGETWGEPTVVGDGVADGVYYWDQRIISLGGDRLFVIFWTHSLATDKDLSVHWATSEDGGRTWTKPQPTNIQGQVTCPVDLEGGRMAAVYNLRYADRPGVMATLSEDGGRTWDLDNQVAIWDAYGEARVGVAAGGRELQQHVTIAFGKPDAQLLADGDILATFWCTQACVTHIRWCRLRVSGM